MTNALYTEINRLQAENVNLKEEIWHLKNAMKADDERLEAAARKAGIDYFGCDTADVLAATILELRAENEMLAWLCLSHGVISRGKFAALLKIDRCDVDDKIEEITRRLKEAL